MSDRREPAFLFLEEGPATFDAAAIDVAALEPRAPAGIEVVSGLAPGDTILLMP